MNDALNMIKLPCLLNFTKQILSLQNFPVERNQRRRRGIFVELSLLKIKLRPAFVSLRLGKRSGI
jgi:hypothetical protein